MKKRIYSFAKRPLSLATKPKKAEVVSFLPVNFTVEGDPVPQGRPRFFRRGSSVGVYDPPKSKAWKKLVADTAIAHGCKPLDGPLEVTLMFYLKQPNSMKDGQPHIKRPDVDNLAKGVLDALNGICWHDDAQICMLVIEKDYGVWPDVNIEIGPYWKYAEE